MPKITRHDSPITGEGEGDVEPTTDNSWKFLGDIGAPPEGYYHDLRVVTGAELQLRYHDDGRLAMFVRSMNLNSPDRYEYEYVSRRKSDE